jgi:hypothetical protein
MAIMRGLVGISITLMSAAQALAGPPAWNGEESPARGGGWADPPAAARIEPVAEAPHGGTRCLRIDLKGEGWRGVGWNWFGWFPADSRIDAGDATHLVFWLKASRADVALQMRLVDNQKQSTDLIDLAAKELLPRLPTEWREVRVPLASLGGKADRSRLWEIQFGTSTPGDVTLWVDDIGFEPESGTAPGTAGKPFVVRVRVETARPAHAISPYIYGASAVDASTAREFGLTTVRWGGNPSSRYNWRAQAENAGSDWFFLNRKAGRWADFVAANSKHGLVSYVTIPMLPWVAKGPEGWGFSTAKYGPQKSSENSVPDRGDGRKPDGAPITGNDPRDTSVSSNPAFQAQGIRALPAAPAGTPRIYGLDNEPMAWHATHRDVHPEPVGYEEALRLGRDYARAIKQADPNGLVAGPCTWGWTDLTFSAADQGADQFATHADFTAHGNTPFLAWYLAGMRAASRESGRRLLDIVDVHFYPQGQADGQPTYGGKSHSAESRALRVRSTRALWDPAYRDESWIGDTVKLIPRVRAWIDRSYPGTKLCIGEYSWGGDDDPSGAIAQAELLGIFARERVDFAYFWAGLAGVQRFAFQLFRNPDGEQHGFGEQYLNSRCDAADRVSAFAAQRSDGALTIVLVSKELKRPADVRLDLGSVTPGSLTLFRLPNPPGPIVRESVKPTTVRIVVPPLSAVMAVVGPRGAR